MTNRDTLRVDVKEYIPINLLLEYIPEHSRKSLLMFYCLCEKYIYSFSTIPYIYNMYISGENESPGDIERAIAKIRDFDNNFIKVINVVDVFALLYGEIFRVNKIFISDNNTAAFYKIFINNLRKYSKELSLENSLIAMLLQCCLKSINIESLQKIPFTNVLISSSVVKCLQHFFVKYLLPLAIRKFVSSHNGFLQGIIVMHKLRISSAFLTCGWTPSTGGQNAVLQEDFFAKFNVGCYDDAIELGTQLLNRKIVSAPILETLTLCCLYKFAYLDGAILAIIGNKFFPGHGDFAFLAVRLAFLSGEKELALYTLIAYAASPYSHIALERNRIGMKISQTFGDFNWQGILELLHIMAMPERACVKKTSAIANSSSGYTKGRIDAHLRQCEYNVAHQMLLNAENSGYDMSNEWLQYYLLRGMSNEVKDIIHKHDSGNIKLTNISMLFYGKFASGDPGGAFRTLGTDPQFNTLKRYYPDKLIYDLTDDLPLVDTAIILSECYTADELYYSRLYPQIAAKVHANNVIFTCDPRSYPILKHTFPDLNFLPCHKARELEFITDLSLYDAIPGSDCIRYIDNVVAAQCRNADRLITVMHALGSVITGYDSYKNLPELQVDAAKRSKYREKLESLKKDRGAKYVVGLGWRSSISDPRRDMNVLSQALLRELLGLPDILWINCQYDGLRVPEQKFFNAFDNFINFPDVDQYNDIDSTGALYASLDIMLSAPTFTSDFAAAVGTSVVCPASNMLFKSYCFPGTGINCILPKCEFYLCQSPENFSELIRHMRHKLAT